KGKEPPAPNGEKISSSKEAWGPSKKGPEKDKIEKEKDPTPPPQEQERHHSEEWQDASLSEDKEPDIENISPTPRPDRISKDYEKEYPSIEIEGRTTVRRIPEREKDKNKEKDRNKEKTKTIENVKLDGEEVCSDDEWEGLIDATDQEGDPEQAIQMLKDSKFHARLNTRIQNSSTQVLDGMLEGAAKLKSVLRIITNLITLKCDLKWILTFVKALSIPQQPLKMIHNILSKPTVRQQPWCQQILIDLVITVNAYFASEVSWNDDIDKEVGQLYLNAMTEYMSLVPKLLNVSSDEDLRLREQVILCSMYTCEAMERDKLKIGNQYFTHLAAKETDAIDAILACCKLEEARLKKLIEWDILEELTDGNEDMAGERMDMLISLGVTTVAAMVNLPLTADDAVDGRRKIGHYLGDKMACKGNEKQTDEFFMLLRHPLFCTNVLKIMYACCQVSTTLCSYISNQVQHMDSLMGILMGKVEIQDMEVNSVIEMILHIYSTIVIQLQTMPTAITDAASVMISIFLESTIASHTAAAALVFSQMIYCGLTVEVQPEEMLQACLAVFTDLQQICVRCPFDYGVLDGLLLLLCEMLAQTEGPVAQMYIETGIWGTLWHRVAQALQVINLETDTPIHDIDQDGENVVGFNPPDWTLVSPQGLMAVLQMAVTVFTKETNQCIPNLAVPDSIILLTIVHLLHKDFLSSVYNGFHCDGPQLTADMILEVTQLCCFPFAVDIAEELLHQVQQCLFNASLLPRLIFCCTKYLKNEQLEIPINLMLRLVLGSQQFLKQFCKCVKEQKTVSLLTQCTQSTSSTVVSDVVSICSHLVRMSPQHAPFVKSVFHGSKGDYDPLSKLIKHNSATVRSRACSLVGNLMKHNSHMYGVLKQREKLLNGLIAGLKDEDPNVRKKLNQELQDALDDREQLKSQVQDYMTEVKRTEDLLNRKESERSDLLEQYRALSVEAEQYQTSSHQLESEGSNLRLELMTKDSEIRRNRDKIDNLEREIQEHLNAQQAYELQVSNLTRSVGNLEENLRIVEEEKQNLLVDLTAVRELCAKLEGSKESLQRQLTSASLDREQLQNLVDDMRQETDLLKSQVSAERTNLKSLEGLLQNNREKEFQTQLNQQEKSAEIQMLKDRLSLNESKIQSQGREIASLRTRNVELEGDVERLRRNLTSEKFERERACQELKRHGFNPPIPTMDFSTSAGGSSYSYHRTLKTTTTSRTRSRSRSRSPSPARYRSPNTSYLGYSAHRSRSPERSSYLDDIDTSLKSLGNDVL
ncbi:fused, partial [Mytilus galloprovincialis]